MFATLRYILITAIRDRLVIALLLALLLAVSGAMFVASSALAEQNAFGLAFASEATRLILCLGLITFICFHIRRMHETREIEAILARPISRAAFIVACFFAYATLVMCLTMAAAGLLGVAFVTAPGGLLEWAVSLSLEGLIVVAMGLFAAMALENATSSVLVALGFYIFARSGATFRFIVENRTATTDSETVNYGIRLIIKGLAIVLPRIDLFGQSRWLIDGPGGGWGVGELVLQTLLYVPLLLAATVRDLQVKRF